MLIFSVALRLAGVACIALLLGCTGTSDIIAEDSSTLVGSAGFERKLSDRGALEGRYLVTGGTSQDGGSIIQIDGERFDATGARNSFQLHVLSMHYRFHLINSDRFRLTIAPGAEASHVELATKLPTRQINSSETSVGLGMKLGMAFSFSDSLSLEHEFSVTNQSSNERLVSTGLWFNYDWNKTSRLKAGYYGEYLGTSFAPAFGRDNGDGCLELDAPEAGNCSDSRLRISASGLFVGYQYRF
jgi:hypothetical protein